MVEYSVVEVACDRVEGCDASDRTGSKRRPVDREDIRTIAKEVKDSDCLWAKIHLSCQGPGGWIDDREFPHRTCETTVHSDVHGILSAYYRSAVSGNILDPGQEGQVICIQNFCKKPHHRILLGNDQAVIKQAKFTKPGIRDCYDPLEGIEVIFNNGVLGGDICEISRNQDILYRLGINDIEDGGIMCGRIISLHIDIIS